MSALIQDLRFGLRMLAKNPGFTAVAVITLALGIGANTAMFTLVNALILRSLPVRDPQELIAVSTNGPGAQNVGDPLPVPAFKEISKHQRVFTQMAGSLAGALVEYEIKEIRYLAGADLVSGEYFPTLGIQPLLGRLITPGDVALDEGTANPVAVISYGCWRRRFNGDPATIGKTIRVSGQPFTIIGVTPRRFTGFLLDAAPDAFVPLGSSSSVLQNHTGTLSLPVSVVGRLKPGVTLEQARAQLTALWPAVQAATLPPEYKGQQRARFLEKRIEIESFATGNSYLRRQFKDRLEILMGLAGMVLLICCVNLAGLTLARVTARGHELGIRVALGASRCRLIGQASTESVVLSVSGSLLGIVFASWASRSLANSVWPGYIPLDLDLSPDTRVLVFTTALTAATVLVFGVIPAWLTAGISPLRALQQNTRSVHSSAGVLAKGLVIAQVSLSLILVIGATLLTRSLERLRSGDLGYSREGVLITNLFPQPGREKIPNRTAYYRELSDKLSRLPGVDAVSYSHMGPVLPYEYKVPVVVSAVTSPVDAVEDWVGPGFFRLIGMRLLQGRDFDWRDDDQAPPVAIISESLGRHLFPGASPVGRRIDILAGPKGKNLEIVGLVNSASLWKPQSYSPMAIYIPFAQSPWGMHPTIELRTSGDPMSLASSTRRTIESMGNEFPLRIQTLGARLDEDLSVDHVAALISAFFAGLALLIASVGLYSLIAYGVSQRTAEIGVRRALGARQGDIIWMVTREALSLVIFGVAIGLAGALVVGRVLSSVLYEIKPTDGLSFAASACVMMAVAFMAGCLPARRAAKVDPMVALRYE